MEHLRISFTWDQTSGSWTAWWMNLGTYCSTVSQWIVTWSLRLHVSRTIQIQHLGINLLQTISQVQLVAFRNSLDWLLVKCVQLPDGMCRVWSPGGFLSHAIMKTPHRSRMDAEPHLRLKLTSIDPYISPVHRGSRLSLASWKFSIYVLPAFNIICCCIPPTGFWHTIVIPIVVICSPCVCVCVCVWFLVLPLCTADNNITSVLRLDLKNWIDSCTTF